MIRSREEICNDLIRHVEIAGSEAFNKCFVRSNKIECTVWCMIGPNAEAFNEIAEKWMEDNGFKRDNE
jgi:hypothetical protein